MKKLKVQSEIYYLAKNGKNSSMKLERVISGSSYTAVLSKYWSIVYEWAQSQGVIYFQINHLTTSKN